jgi:sugar transferase EpsL
MDVTIVLIASPIVVPLTLGVALIVRFRLGSPVLFTQVRAGCSDETFRLYKFRTMAAQTTEGADLSDAERLTPFGRKLRAMSLDELPSLLNVLRGEMSLVGPRPLPVAYVDRYGPVYRRRLDVPPGVTGWAQINGRNRLGWGDRFDLDLWYVDNASLSVDIRILIRTIANVLRRADVNALDHATMSEFLGFESDAGPNEQVSPRDAGPGGDG